MIALTTAAPALGAAFVASLVEVVEAFTIVLAAGTLRGWRSAIAGTAAGLVVLALIVVALGPLLDRVPLHLLQLVIGVLLLLFGMGWLRKAVLRAAGLIPLHDENAAFAAESENLSKAIASRDSVFDWLGGVMAFKAVLLEGLEVVFIVIAVGAGRGLIAPASLGALAAFVLVLVIGAIVRRPLARVPENTLKFAVGVVLSAFGVFWTGEGLGIAWPGADLMVLFFGAAFLLVGVGAAGLFGNRLEESRNEHSARRSRRLAEDVRRRCLADGRHSACGVTDRFAGECRGRAATPGRDPVSRFDRSAADERRSLCSAARVRAIRDGQSAHRSRVARDYVIAPRELPAVGDRWRNCALVFLTSASIA